MSNPFFLNHGPLKIFDIFNLLDLEPEKTISDQNIFDINDLSLSNENEITFFHSKKYKNIANNTKASFCITTELLKDYYLTMSNIDRSDYYNIKFQKKPFMIWIWISVIFISLGGFLRVFKNEN